MQERLRTTVTIGYYWVSFAQLLLVLRKLHEVLKNIIQKHHPWVKVNVHDTLRKLCGQGIQKTTNVSDQGVTDNYFFLGQQPSFHSNFIKIQKIAFEQYH